MFGVSPAELHVCPRKLDVRNHQCSDDRTFIRTGAISPTWYVYRTKLQALSNVLMQARSPDIIDQSGSVWSQ